MMSGIEDILKSGFILLFDFKFIFWFVMFL